MSEFDSELQRISHLVLERDGITRDRVLSSVFVADPIVGDSVPDTLAYVLFAYKTESGSVHAAFVSTLWEFDEEGGSPTVDEAYYEIESESDFRIVPNIDDPEIKTLMDSLTWDKNCNFEWRRQVLDNESGYSKSFQEKPIPEPSHEKGDRLSALLHVVGCSRVTSSELQLGRTALRDFDHAVGKEIRERFDLEHQDSLKILSLGKKAYSRLQKELLD